jgi:hypothetical protein
VPRFFRRFSSLGASMIAFRELSGRVNETDVIVGHGRELFGSTTRGTDIPSNALIPTTVLHGKYNAGSFAGNAVAGLL